MKHVISTVSVMMILAFTLPMAPLHAAESTVELFSHPADFADGDNHMLVVKSRDGKSTLTMACVAEKKESLRIFVLRSQGEYKSGAVRVDHSFRPGGEVITDLWWKPDSINAIGYAGDKLAFARAVQSSDRLAIRSVGKSAVFEFNDPAGLIEQWAEMCATYIPAL